MNLLSQFAYSYGTNYGYYHSNTSSVESMGTWFILLLLLIPAVAIAGYVIMSLFFARIFKLAGLPAWKAWVPIYNQWIFFQLGGYSGVFVLLPFVTIIPVIGFFASIVYFVFFCFAAQEIGKKVGKSDIFILVPLGLVTFGITTYVWFYQVGNRENVWNDSLGKESLAEGTILGYAETEEETEVQEAEVVKEEKAEDKE